MNRKPFSIPVVAIGPGSQPADDAPAYMEMPHGMRTFSMPLMPEPKEIGKAAPVRRIIERLCEIIDRRLHGASAEAVIDLGDLDVANLALLNQLLGEGEVAAMVTSGTHAHIQETVFAGVWRVRFFESDGSLLQDWIEVGPVPVVLKKAAMVGARPRWSGADAPAGVMNAPGVLSEIAGKLADYEDGDEPWVINLTLLPGTPEDAAYLSGVLGTGPVSILSRGYGNCRMHSTAVQNVWRVQFFNSQDKLILDTIEVTSVPAAALAARQDLEDSRERLAELQHFIEHA